MAGFTVPTPATLRYLHDLAVRVNATIPELVDQYGTYTRIGSSKHLSQRDASNLIRILERRLGYAGRRRERAVGASDHATSPHPHAHAMGRRR